MFAKTLVAEKPDDIFQWLFHQKLKKVENLIKHVGKNREKHFLRAFTKGQ